MFNTTADLLETADELGERFPDMPNWEILEHVAYVHKRTSTTSSPRTLSKTKTVKEAKAFLTSCGGF